MVAFLLRNLIDYFHSILNIFAPGWNNFLYFLLLGKGRPHPRYLGYPTRQERPKIAHHQQIVTQEGGPTLAQERYRGDSRRRRRFKTQI